MLTIVLIACLLVVITVAMHAVGFSALLRAVMRSHALTMSGFLPLTRLMVGLACGLMLIHLAEIGVWGVFYLLQECMPDVWTAVYFSGVTYSTLGYGDIVLPGQWRMLAPIEAMTGILMCGLSTGLFFAIINQWLSNWLIMKASSEPQPR